jgi:hypothetical protein
MKKIMVSPNTLHITIGEIYLLRVSIMKMSVSPTVVGCLNLSNKRRILVVSLNYNNVVYLLELIFNCVEISFFLTASFVFHDTCHGDLIRIGWPVFQII